MLIYLIRQENTESYKVGITGDMPQRVKSLQTGCANKIEVLSTFESEYARNIENFLHKAWKHKNTSGEWFTLDYDDQKTFIPFCKKMHENLTLYNKHKNNLVS